MSATVNTSTVTVEEVRHIADLSNLRLTPEEEISMQRDLNAILNYVAELKELDTSAVTPMAQVSEMLVPSEADSATSGQARGLGFQALPSSDSRAVLRSDERRPSLDRQRVMRSAPETDEVFFKVPKVIER